MIVTLLEHLDLGQCIPPTPVDKAVASDKHGCDQQSETHERCYSHQSGVFAFFLYIELLLQPFLTLCQATRVSAYILIVDLERRLVSIILGNHRDE